MGQRAKMSDAEARWARDVDIIMAHAAHSDRVAVCRILRDVAERIEAGEIEGQIRDINGNKVGSYGTGRV